MLWKILIPAIAIAAVYFLGRSHAIHNRPPGGEAPSLPDAPDPRRSESPLARRSRRAIFSAALLVILASGWFIYRQWAAGERVATIRVIDIRSNQVSVYRAKAKDIHARTFITTDGRRVTLADLERMEVVAEP